MIDRYSVHRSEQGFGVWDHRCNGWRKYDLDEVSAFEVADWMNTEGDTTPVQPTPPPRSPVDAGPAPTGWHQVLDPPLLVLVRNRSDGVNGVQWDEALLRERLREARNWIGLVWVKGEPAPRWVHEDDIREHPDARPD